MCCVVTRVNVYIIWVFLGLVFVCRVVAQVNVYIIWVFLELAFACCVVASGGAPLVDVGFCVWRWLKLFVKLSKYHFDYSFINLFCCFCVKVM